MSRILADIAYVRSGDKGRLGQMSHGVDRPTRVGYPHVAAGRAMIEHKGKLTVHPQHAGNGGPGGLDVQQARPRRNHADVGRPDRSGRRRNRGVARGR